MQNNQKNRYLKTLLKWVEVQYKKNWGKSCKELNIIAKNPAR